MTVRAPTRPQTGPLRGATPTADTPKATEAAPAQGASSPASSAPRTEVPDAAIASNTAGEFASVQGAPRSGHSALGIRLGGEGVPMSQQDMNREAAREMRGKRDEMRGANKSLVDSVAYDPLTQDELRSAQSAFEIFAQQDSVFQANLEARGGSLAPLIQAGAAGRHFAERSALLGRALEEGSFPGESRAANMDDANTQLEMNQAAYASFNVADERMLTVQSALAQLLGNDPESQTELRTAQEAFRAYREVQGEAAGNMEARGGSLAPLIRAGTLEYLTHARTAQLEAKLVELGGTVPAARDPVDLDGNGITSQQEMNQVSANDAASANQKMEAALEGALAKLSYDVENGPELKSAQKAFVAFAEADALFYANANARGGSMMPMLYAGTESRHFEARAKDLNVVATEGYFPYQGTSDVDGPQLVMNQAAYAKYQEVNAKLDAAVGKLRAKMQEWDPESVAELDKAQTAFADYREQQAVVAGNAEARGGSLFGLIHASSLEGLTQARLDQVNQYLADLSSL